MSNEEVKKKRLLYDKSEDIYFLTYNILLLLDNLGCTSKDKVFKDYRKLTFLIPLISDEVNIKMFIDYYRGGKNINKNIRRKLKKLYYDGIENIQLIRYVLLILEKNNFIALISEENKVNLYINDRDKYKAFLENDKFIDELKCINNIKGNKYQISRISYSTFINYLFKANGVSVWEE